MESFAFIVALLLIGILLQKAPAPADFSKSLNFFVIYVSLPATVLMQMPKIHFDLSALGVVIVPWLLLPIMVLIVILMTRNQPVQVRAALLLVIPLGNTSFVGIPIVEALLGAGVVDDILVIAQIETAKAIEDACRQAATEDRVATKEMDDYMEDCMADALQNLDDEANPLFRGDVRPRHGGDAEMAPEGDQEPAPID